MDRRDGVTRRRPCRRLYRWSQGMRYLYLLLICHTRDGGKVPTGSSSHVTSYEKDIMAEASEPQKNMNQKLLKTLGGVCKPVIVWM